MFTLVAKELYFIIEKKTPLNMGYYYILLAKYDLYCQLKNHSQRAENSFFSFFDLLKVMLHLNLRQLNILFFE